MGNVTQRNTFFSMRITEEVRAVLKLANLNGNDVSQYVLESVAYKLDHGKRLIRPELLEALTRCELAAKLEYDEKIRTIQAIREAVENNNRSFVQIGPSRIQEINAEGVCPYCDRDMKDGRCTCAAWRSRHPKAAEGMG